MNPWKAAFIATLHNEGTWDFESYVICYCASGSEVAVGELLFTLIADAMYHTGGGFAVQRAGVNLSSTDLNRRALPSTSSVG